MKSFILCCCLALTATAAAADDAWKPIYTPADPSVIVRGQAPLTYAPPPAYAPSPYPQLAYQPVLQPPVPAQGQETFYPPTPMYQGQGQGQPMPANADPFLYEGAGGPGMTSPYYNELGSGHYGYGANGPQPYKFGWTSRADYTYLATAGTTPAVSNLEIWGLDTESKYTSSLPTGWIYSSAHQFDLRGWEGPLNSPATPGLGLPSHGYRFGYDMELSTPVNGPWSIQLAFTPSIGTSFEQSLTSDAWMFDGRAIAFYRTSPYWMYAFGIGYWDRVRDKIIPYVGGIWTPDDRWEFRIMFPQSRISYFIGQHGGYDKWLYVTGEYHVEAYEIELETNGVRNQVEFADWRVMGGIRADNGLYSLIMEAGFVFGRDVVFKYRNAPNFDVDSGFIARMGIRF